jgi:carbamate kinase
MLATALGASRLIVLIDVAGAALSFATAEQQFIDRMTVEAARLNLQRAPLPGAAGGEHLSDRPAEAGTLAAGAFAI